MSDTAFSSAGEMPRTSAGRRFAPAASMPSIVTNGATPATPGTPAKRACHAAPVLRARPATAIVACALTLKQPRPRLRLETVHHRQNDDERRDAERDADERRDAHERDTTPRRRRERR